MSEPDAMVLIDQGSHSSRAILFAANGQQLAQSQIAVELLYRDGGRVEMNVQAVLDSLDQVLADIARQAHALGIRRIGKAGLIVQRSSFLACCRQTFAPLTPVISWMDSRNAAWLATQQARFPEIQAITGLYPNAHYALSKIRWLLAQQPGLADRHAQGEVLFVPLAAYLCRHLTQSASLVVDAAIASRTLLMDLQHRQWNNVLLALAGISADALPPVVASDEDFGEIQAGHYRIPLQLTGGDQSFIAFSAGIDAAPHHAFINMGSGAFVQALCPQLPQQTRLLKSPLFIGQQTAFMALEGTVNAAASALDWLFAHGGNLSARQLEQALHEHTVDVPLYANTLAGSGSPHWLAAAPPHFSYTASLPQQAVAILESVVFALTENLAQITPHCTVHSLYVSGGLSQSDALCQRLADCTGMDVLRYEDHEASARGAAFFMLAIPHNKAPLMHFRPAANAALLSRYQQYGRMMLRLCQTH